jgi:hypothetical protein
MKCSGRADVAAEQRGAKVKKKLEIDPLHADTVRLIYRLALEGDGTSGPMGVRLPACDTFRASSVRKSVRVSAMDIQERIKGFAESGDIAAE